MFMGKVLNHVKSIDKIFFNKKLLKFYENKKLNDLEKKLGYKISIFYNSESDNLFSKLCDKYGSDKGNSNKELAVYPWPAHTYSDLYTRLFSHCRQNIKFVFECGLGTNNELIPSNMTSQGKPGASLRVWRDYFPNAQIIGADIDKQVLFNEDKIKTFYVDQTSSESVCSMWNLIDVKNFDLMVDDGLHTFEAGINLFINSIHRLSDFGIYLIEDIGRELRQRYFLYFKNPKLVEKFSIEYISLERPNLTLGDNGLILIRKK